jgi:hypothetical protein
MSDNLPQNRNNEEVDLLILFDYFGKSLNKVYNFFFNIFKGIFSGIIYALKPLVRNFKLIIIIIITTAVLGYIVQKSQPEIYNSQMLVKPYFDSKYQLITNIMYYNALISEKDYKQLTEIFGISVEDAEKIISFEIHPGPENENDQVVQYDRFVKSIDSVRAQDISFDEFIENRSIYSGDIFEIDVTSYKKDIFRSLEEGLNTTFTNTYSVKKMQKRDSLISIERQRILASIKQVDSLQDVYIGVMGEEATSNQGAYTTKDGMTFIQEKTKTKEYELLKEGMALRQALSQLDSQKVEEDVYFDTLSSFQDTGARYSSIWNMYVLIFPLLAFVIFCVVLIIKNLIRFISNYEA